MDKIFDEKSKEIDNIAMARKNVIALVDCDSFLYLANSL